MLCVGNNIDEGNPNFFKDNCEAILAQQMQVEKENKLAHYKSKIKSEYLHAAKQKTKLAKNKNIDSDSRKEIPMKWKSFEEFISHDRYGNRLPSYDDMEADSQTNRNAVCPSDRKGKGEEDISRRASENEQRERSSFEMISYSSNSINSGQSIFIARVRSNTEEVHFMNQSRNNFNEHMASITNPNGGTTQFFFLDLLSSLIQNYKIVLSKETEGAQNLKEKLTRVGQSLQATVNQILSRTPHFSSDPAFNFARDIISQPVFLSSDREEERRMKNRFVFWTLCYHRVVKSYSYDPPLRLFSIDSEVNKERTEITKGFLGP